MSLIRLTINRISYSKTHNGAYALLLNEKNGNRKLPIVIGGFEAQSIAVALESEIRPPRPLTHDLFKNFSDCFEIKIKQVIIHKIVDGVFFSSLICVRDKIEEIIDSSTSDAIALAIRFDSPIFTYESVLEKAGIELATIYRPLNNVFLNKTMEKIRTENICKNQIKKGRAGSREIIKNVKNGKSIAIMIDQRVREGEKVNFFNHLATTTTIPAQLIKKYDCELVPVYIERIKNNYFKMFISKPIKINNKKSIIEITKFLNDLLERMILRNIDQWIWTHNRWKD